MKGRAQDSYVLPVLGGASVTRSNSAVDRKGPSDHVFGAESGGLGWAPLPKRQSARRVGHHTRDRLGEAGEVPGGDEQSGGLVGDNLANAARGERDRRDL